MSDCQEELKLRGAAYLGGALLGLVSILKENASQTIELSEDYEEVFPEIKSISGHLELISEEIEQIEPLIEKLVRRALPKQEDDAE